MFKFIFLFLVGIMLTPLPVFAQPDTVRLSTHDLCPYGCYDDSGLFDGVAVEVVRYALDRMGIGLQLKVVPWKRAQIIAESGETDGFFAASRNSERDGKGKMSAIIAEQKWNWYLLKCNDVDPQHESFKTDATVGGFVGSNMLQWLESNGYNVVAMPKNTELLASMLLARRFDAMLANDQVMSEIIERKSLNDKLKIVTLKNKPLGVYFSNRFVQAHPGFLKQFNSHVKAYRKAHP